MDPVVKFYLTWGVIAAVLAVVIYVGMGMRGELEGFPPPLRAGAAIVIAIVLVIVPSRSRYGMRGSSMFQRDRAAATKLSAQDQSVRDNAAKLLESSKTKSDVMSAADLIRTGNSLHDRGWTDEALPLYDRAHQILVAKGAGNGDWAVDSWMLQLLPNYQADLKAAGRAREAGALVAMEQSLRTRHAGKIP